MTGLAAAAGMAGEAGPDGASGHGTVAGAGGLWLSDVCGLIVLQCCRQPSMTILASAGRDADLPNQPTCRINCATEPRPIAGRS